MWTTTIYFVTFLFYFVRTISSQTCISLDISLTQKVDNEGFHRDIRWLLEILSPHISTWTANDCHMALQLPMTASMFVNPDQIADLNRLNQISAYIDGTVDVETIAHESTEHTVYIFVPDTLTEKVLLKLPIHLRYQRAQITGGFSKAILPKPSILVHCSKSKLCGTPRNVVAPCDVSATSVCEWNNVTYQALFEEVEMYIPIGDLDDYSYVSVVTLLLGCAGCIYILSILSSAPL